MSTKATILLSDANEMWYLEQNAPYYEDTKTETALVLEINSEHKIRGQAPEDGGGIVIVIEEGTPLFRAIEEMRAPHAREQNQRAMKELEKLLRKEGQQ